VAITTLNRVGLPRGGRIFVERPFGEGLDGAIELNALSAGLSAAVGERALFRVDRVLGLATVQNLLGLGLANRRVEPLWSGAPIERIDVLWEETLALEGRAGYPRPAGTSGICATPRSWCFARSALPHPATWRL
jgi:glucose-6-phosphate 1-dehydrogenase